MDNAPARAGRCFPRSDVPGPAQSPARSSAAAGSGAALAERILPESPGESRLRPFLLPLAARVSLPDGGLRGESCGIVHGHANLSLGICAYDSRRGILLAL